MTDTPNPNPANLDDDVARLDPVEPEHVERRLATASESGEVREHIGYADVRTIDGRSVTVAVFGPALNDEAEADDAGPIIG